MNPLWPAVAMVVAVFAAMRIAGDALDDPDERIFRPNYGGVMVPLVLGRVLISAVMVAVPMAAVLATLAGPVPDWPLPLLLLGCSVVLYYVGTLDDRRSRGPRGIAGHMGSLLQGRATTGILKLVAGVAASVLLAVWMAEGALRVIVATLVIALAINVTNALDVRPGRALKWGLLILISTGAAAFDRGIVLALAAYVGAGAVVLVLDLGEEGMLGDAGSNPLGLAVGAGLASVLPTQALVVALAVLIGLQVAAETVTISRLIDFVPPLRWLDGIGRKN